MFLWTVLEQFCLAIKISSWGVLKLIASFSQPEWEWDRITKPIHFLGSFKLTNHIAGNWKAKKPLFANLAIKSCDFKMDLIKWQLNFGSCNFGLKSNRTRATRSFNLKSRVWFQTKLHSIHFNYHYKLHSTQFNYHY